MVFVNRHRNPETPYEWFSNSHQGLPNEGEQSRPSNWAIMVLRLPIFTPRKKCREANVLSIGIDAQASVKGHWPCGLGHVTLPPTVTLALGNSATAVQWRENVISCRYRLQLLPRARHNLAHPIWRPRVARGTAQKRGIQTCRESILHNTNV